MASNATTGDINDERPPREQRIDFVRRAIDEHNRTLNEENIISVYNTGDGPANRNVGTPISHWLWFQTKSMDNLLNIPQDKPEGYYYRYWFQATDSSSMAWKFSLESGQADDTMRRIMMSIAEKRGDSHNVEQIRNGRGTIVIKQDCDFSSKELAEESLKVFLSWEQELCGALVDKGNNPPTPIGDTMTYIESKIDLLEKSKNLILTGAPGTGKTFLARQMAMKMIAGKTEEKDLSDEQRVKFKDQCRFVQFHPSYDYTDFVEGLRPAKPDEKGNIGFELKNGIFKEFCTAALTAWKDDEKLPVEERRKFVFIIDEINRGEISKIFGELFFSIDPGYRGKGGKVQTQYANIQSDETETIFDTGEGQGWFYVPENVYIIGTMNDIDRSVESFDFAMRRRFVWEEIKADDTAAFMGLSSETISRLKRINEAIGKVEGLGLSYHIGGAYFLRKQNGETVELGCGDAWKFRLEPLLREYLRGMPDGKTHLNDFHKAFDPTYNSGPQE